MRKCLFYNNCFKETANEVCFSLSLYSDIAAACRCTFSEQLNKLKHTGGDCCTQPLKFEQNGRVISENNNKSTQQKWEQQRARTIIELRLF